MISRRQFLYAAGTIGVTALMPKGAISKEPKIIRAKKAYRQLAPSGYGKTPIWGYDGSTPGPLIKLKQGTRLIRRFVNELPQPSTIHWHGIRIANAMDGVPDMTQSATPPGESFDYDFELPDAGTYWYHPHNRTWEQMARGLYGALIVEETTPPDVDRDEALMIDDWRLTGGARISDDFGAMMDWSHAGRIGNWITVNGNGEYKLPVRRFERLRLRLINAANARIFSLGLSGLQGWIVALDGQPLAAPVRADQISLAPAQRVDLIVDIIEESGARAHLMSLERGRETAIATFEVKGEARGKRLGTPRPLPPNPVPPLGPLQRARRVTLRMEGGAMGGMRGAMMGGHMMGMRGLVNAGKVWAFNGVADMPREPLMAASMGETIRIEMVNNTAWPHAMHLHGHHFRKLSADGRKGPLRDTLLVDPEETAEIAFLADNPGDWLLHCHMLEHSAGGMMTWLRVS